MTDYKDRVSGLATDIDWSKAPEGATHYRKSVDAWYKQDHRAWEWKGGRWDLIANDLGEFRWANQLIERPAIPVWNGEGLPPVGTLCEHDGSLSMRIPWSEVRILAHAQIRGIDVAVFQRGDTISYSSAGNFRPIKTPEQIAAELADQAIKKIAAIICRDGAFDIDDPEVSESAVALYDAGLRFPKGEDQ